MAGAIKILFLASNPRGNGKLGLDKEIRTIDQVLRQAKFRKKFLLNQQWAVRVSELQSHFHHYQPDIVHFSGHGSEASEIILENDNGRRQAVPSRALSQLFSVLKGNIRCVVLNACYTKHQAQAIARHIDCVIGMSNAIEDQASIQFAAAFYQALGYGKDVQTAFDSGCVQIGLTKSGRHNTPKLLAPNCNPRDVVFVRVPGAASKRSSVNAKPKPISATPPAAPPLWRAEVVAKDWLTRTIKISLAQDHHMIYFRYYPTRLRQRTIIKVDGQIVMQGGHGFQPAIKLDFSLSNAGQEYPASIEAHLNFWLERVEKFRLSIAGDVVYEER